MCKKHKPVWMFPFYEDVPEGRKALFFALAINTNTHLAICEDCGCLAHPIKSRRGGFRWHTWTENETKQRQIKEAIEFWQKVALSPPAFLSSFACR